MDLSGLDQSFFFTVSFFWRSSPFFPFGSLLSVCESEYIFAPLPGHHSCHQHHYFLSEKQTGVAVSLRAVSAAAASRSLLSGCGRAALGSLRITLPHALPPLLRFIHVFLSCRLFSGGSENVVAGEYFPIPSWFRKDNFNHLNQLELFSVEGIKYPPCPGQGGLKERRMSAATACQSRED